MTHEGPLVEFIFGRLAACEVFMGHRPTLTQVKVKPSRGRTDGQECPAGAL
jgi:hypothetical protein